MMETKDFVNFLEFKRKQMLILNEKEEKYRDEPWKELDQDDVLERIEDLMDIIDYDGLDIEGKQRKLLHIANYVFFLHENLKQK